MPYYELKFLCLNVLEVEKHFTWKYKSKRTSRAPKCAKTSAAVQNHNERLAENNLRRKINANFVPGDYSLVLDYQNGNQPGGAKEVTKIMGNFFKRLKRALLKLGQKIKYIYTTEVGKRGTHIHHHIIMNKIDPAILSKCWPFGRVHISILDRSGNYEKLAHYIIKETRRQFRNPEKRFSGKRWNGSKNLEQPKVYYRHIKADSWKEDPKPLKGWYISKPPVTGVNPITGYAYQFYTMQKIVDKVFPDYEEVQINAKPTRQRAHTRSPVTRRPHRKPHVLPRVQERQLSLWPDWQG